LTLGAAGMAKARLFKREIVSADDSPATAKDNQKEVEARIRTQQVKV
jgi:hypothetical protein